MDEVSYQMEGYSSSLSSRHANHEDMTRSVLSYTTYYFPHPSLSVLFTMLRYFFGGGRSSRSRVDVFVLFSLDDMMLNGLI